MDSKLVQIFNKQINHEFYSAYLYFAMSTYFSEIAMDGFSKFMKHKASMKLCCAQKIYDYIILRGEKLIFSKIDEPSADWINVSDIFTSALSHEEFIYECVLELYRTANETKDYAAVEFVKKMLDKQIETLSIFRKILFKVKNQNVISLDIKMLDDKINSFGY